jgi:hypothetical protein
VAVTGVGHRIVIEGAAAIVRLGYQTAATLGPWRVEGDFFTAQITSADRFRLTQAPLTLEIPNRDGIPTRRALTDARVTAIERAGLQLSARLVPNHH